MLTVDNSAIQSDDPSNIENDEWEGWPEGDPLGDVSPVPSGVPIRHIPHATLLMNLADEFGFQQGFCKWAEAVTAVYDHTASLRGRVDVRGLVYRANTQLEGQERERSEKRALTRSRDTEFAATPTPLRTTLEAMCMKLGLNGTVAALGWQPHTVVGWLLGAKAAKNAHGWLVATHLVRTGAPIAHAAHVGMVQPQALQKLCERQPNGSRAQVATLVA